MTSIDTRPVSTDPVAEAARLRDELADRDRQIAALKAEMAAMQRRVDDVLDRESMHVYDADMERLATPAALERLGTARASHVAADRGTATHPRGRTWSRPIPQAERTQAGGLSMEWEGFSR
ncbi:hypothetical protein ACIBQ0_17630 [Nocardia nova]|uniref:hypothetical protein n=1 Tax=Nocardia nova TaxID=37330 RepID=UPI0037964165